MKKHKMFGVVLSMLSIHSCIQYTISAALYQVNSTEIPNVTRNMFKSQDARNISEVKLDHFRIKTIDKDAFNDLVNLNNLDLSKNDIETLAVGTFQYTLNLQTINLGSNELSELKNGIFAKLYNVSELGLYKNVISSIGAMVFVDLLSLTHLNLRDNHIATLDARIFRRNINLEYLSLSFNYIKTLDRNIFRYLGQLTQLFMKNIQMSHIERDLLAHLFELRQLSISSNLQEIPAGIFRNTNKLNTLWLNNNALSHLPDGLLTNLRYLNFLQIEQNTISYIGIKALPKYKSLRKVYMANNRMHSLNKSTIAALQGVTVLSLHGNPWTCDDCHVKELYSVWKNCTSSGYPTCAAPQKLKNVTWDTLTGNDFPACDSAENLERPIVIAHVDKVQNTSESNWNRVPTHGNTSPGDQWEQQANQILDVPVGGNVSLNCSILDGHIVWIHNNTIMRYYTELDEFTQQTPLRITVTSTFSITNVSFEDGGTYVCRKIFIPVYGQNYYRINVYSMHHVVATSMDAWKIAGFVLLAAVIFAVIIGTIVLVVRNRRQISTIYDVPLNEPFNPENVQEYDKDIYDEVQPIPEKTLNINAELYDELKDATNRRSSVDNYGYLKPIFINSK